ncbi:dihydrofolate reductase [Halanaerobium sp. Z-7514]|uniref:Dihydrofolate reductase n=1 Tax=Halanaerobium polyolivorans TaxID=2886943 RepID=A0AAW4WS48_9FIRM|nr:dihydrofolate reductase [Halanaerobium polyolivorans]RQD78297.1 MAG: hypothetical protein D5S01_01565 [Halanaerobium sp. MSAO_Bac5]
MESPLAGREKIILTRDENYSAKGCEVVHSKEEILNRFLDQENYSKK